MRPVRGIWIVGVLLSASVAHAQTIGLYADGRPQLRVRVGWGPLAEKTSLLFTIGPLASPAPPITLPAISSVLWKMGAGYSAGTWTLTISGSGQPTQTEVVNLTPDAWNQWDLPSPVNLPADLQLTSNGSAEMDFVWTSPAASFSVWPNPRHVDTRLRSNVFVGAGSVTMVVITDAIDVAALDAGCAEVHQVDGWPYDDTEVIELDAGEVVEQVAPVLGSREAIGAVGVGVDFTKPMPADSWVTISQSGAGRSSQPQAVLNSVGVGWNGLVPVLRVDAGAPLLISVGPRTGTMTLRRYTASRPDAGLCDPIVRATWGGGGAFSGRTDSDLPFTYNPCTTIPMFLDDDGDGFGGRSIPLCNLPSSKYVQTAGDCDDTDARVKPGAIEACNGIDDDCDGFIDANDDGLALTDCENQLGACASSKHFASACVNGAWSACTATSFTSVYEAVELSCDGFDNDCDGLTDEVVVGPPCLNQNGVCSGARASECVGASWALCTAADYPASYQPKESACDGLDNDCDGFVDGHDPDLRGVKCELTLGVCARAVHTAEQCGATGWVSCDARDYGPRFEAHETRCDGADNDCDGEVDEGCHTNSCSSGASGPLLLALVGWLWRRRRAW